MNDSVFQIRVFHQPDLFYVKHHWVDPQSAKDITRQKAQELMTSKSKLERRVAWEEMDFSGYSLQATLKIQALEMKPFFDSMKQYEEKTSHLFAPTSKSSIWDWDRISPQGICEYVWVSCERDGPAYREDIHRQTRRSFMLGDILSAYDSYYMVEATGFVEVPGNIAQTLSKIVHLEEKDLYEV